MSEENRPIRVFLIEDHRCVLWGLERLIASAEPSMQVVGSAHTNSESLAGIARSEPDIVLLDLDLGDGSELGGLDLLPQIVQPKRRVLVLTGVRDKATLEQAVVRGASGIVGKSDSAATLVAAIKRVHDGELWLERGMMTRLLGNFIGGREPASSARPRIEPLTAKERQIVRAIVEQRGATSDVIASGLCMSGHTLRNHLTVIYRKLDVRNRLELVLFALEHDLGGAPEPPKRDRALL